MTEGQLVCSGCSACYPIRSAIPRFVSGNGYTDSFGFQWNLHGQTQLDSYTGLPISRKRLFGVTGWPENMAGQVILEAGSGAGRFTEVLLSTGAEIFSFDSSSAVESNWRNNGRSGHLHLFQADIYNLPLRRAAFDKVLCLGVLQHTPDPEKAFNTLTEMIRPGGEFVVDVYWKGITSLLHWKYLLRPIAQRMNKRALYRIVAGTVPLLLPAAKSLRRFAGRPGARLVPIVEYSTLGLPAKLNLEWAILDTFDMYSPAHDHPQTLRTVQRWYEEAGFAEVVVRRGSNGVVGRGRLPAQSPPMVPT